METERLLSHGTLGVVDGQKKIVAWNWLTEGRERKNIPDEEESTGLVWLGAGAPHS